MDRSFLLSYKMGEKKEETNLGLAKVQGMSLHSEDS
jgi:hypothetical protein